MKINTKECLVALQNYKAKNKLEKLAVKVLTTKDEEVCKIPEIIKMSDEQIDALVSIINKIREDIGIE